MIESLVPTYPHLRRPPDHVVRGLRAIDPTAELVYVGWGRWLLGSVRPHIEHRETGERLLARAARLLTLWETNPKVRANPGAFRRLIGRYDFARLTLMGFRPISEYRVQGEPTSAIVDELRRMDWCYRHIADDELQRAVDAPKDRAIAESRAELTDPGRATDAWRYAFTRSHWYGDRPGAARGPRSGFTRVTPTPVLS